MCTLFFYLQHFRNLNQTIESLHTTLCTLYTTFQSIHIHRFKHHFFTTCKIRSTARRREPPWTRHHASPAYTAVCAVQSGLHRSVCGTSSTAPWSTRMTRRRSCTLHATTGYLHLGTYTFEQDATQHTRAEASIPMPLAVFFRSLSSSACWRINRDLRPSAPST